MMSYGFDLILKKVKRGNCPFPSWRLRLIWIPYDNAKVVRLSPILVSITQTLKSPGTFHFRSYA
jgi:hypothetical protein